MVWCRVASLTATTPNKYRREQRDFLKLDKKQVMPAAGCAYAKH
ncbi:hypothetical protein [Nostoc sp.]